VIKRSSAAETERLVADLLLDGAPVSRESAIARLALLGARAVDRLVAALGAATRDDQRVAILTALERIGDPRAVLPAWACLRAGSAEVALAAIAAMRPHLNADDAAAAATTLDALAGVLLDPARSGDVRLAALGALADLPDEIVAPLTVRLASDPALALPATSGESPSPRDAAGAGPGWSLDRIDALGLPRDPEAVRNAVTTAAAAAPLALLHRLIVLIRKTETEAADGPRAQWLAVRAAVHQALAARGSRVALYDLRETLEQPAALPLAMITALKTVGDASCLEPLASAIARTDEPWLKAHLTEAFTAIRQRERLTRRHALIRRLAERYPELV
jgi:hypothetical protein